MAPSSQSHPDESIVPLVVDLDGTLIKVDSLHEGFVRLLLEKPLDGIRAFFLLGQGRAAFKSAVATHAAANVGSLPLNETVLEAITEARRQGRKVYLATAADRRVAEAISQSMRLFDGVFASEDGVNLKGAAKAGRLERAFGSRGFDYIGNHADDIAVWRTCRNAGVAGASPRFIRSMHAEFPAINTLGVRQPGLSAYVRAVRPHQWLKNALVALPALAAHQFDWQTLCIVLAACISFSLAASTVYLINDVLDLPHDRSHPQKRDRPLASGLIHIRHAFGLAIALACVALGLAAFLPIGFFAVLLFYLMLSLGYSVFLKRKLMIDVVALAALYGTRVLAGAAATGIPLSQWLLGFCFFIFLSLALVKRTAEMVALLPGTSEKIQGRGYRGQDLQTIIALAAASGFVAILVLALYINSPEVRPLYRHPELLWGVSVVLVYWLGRVYLLTGRGEMHHDPVVFAAVDRISLLAGIVVGGIFLFAL